MASEAHHNKISDQDVKQCRGKLLKWYASHERDVPWRVKKDETPDPYKVWLSEIMCQQTTVGAVKAYYQKFLSLWPSIHALAAAEQEEVLSAWAGLGYYARARNLHKCAQIVSKEYDGKFPQTPAELKKLPGIGDYTAAAIAAITFKKAAVVVDGNVERVIARFFAIEQPLPQSKSLIKTMAARFYDAGKEQHGDLAQSFMDLGNSICLPKIPRCALCPLAKSCAAQKLGIAPELPRKTKAKSKPYKKGYVYWIENTKGEVLFIKRPDKGLLASMRALPSSSWEKQITQSSGPFKPPNLEKFEIRRNLRIYHSFTHFDLELTPAIFKGVMLDELEFTDDVTFWWAKPEGEIDNVPSLFRKAIQIIAES